MTSEEAALPWQDDVSGDDGDFGVEQQLDREVAAVVIQEAWRSSRGGDSNEERAGQRAMLSETDCEASSSEADAGTSCCIACFALISLDEPPSTLDGDHALLCADCVKRLANTTATTAHDLNTDSMPKLSRLLRVQAKCNDQLQLLRDQRSLLQQQQEQLQARKQAHADQAAAARALARQRQRQFQQVLERRKREEELKFKQFTDPVGSDAERQDSPAVESDTASMPIDHSVATAVKRRPRRLPFDRKPPPVDHQVPPPTSETSAASLSSSSFPQVDKRSDKRQATLQKDIDTHTQQLWHRRKQMLQCYSEDLAPIVNGHKPKRLPVPAPAPPSVPADKRTDSKRATSSPSVVSTSNQRMSKPRRRKKTLSNGVKLRPLPHSKLTIETPNNQLDDHKPSRARSHFGGSCPSAMSLGSNADSPLTAEIKPVSWIYDLGKDLLSNEDEQQPSAMDYGGPSVLRPVLEDEEHSFAPHSNDTFGLQELELDALFPPLKRQLPMPVTISPLPSGLASNPIATEGSTPNAPLQWQYSTERLAGLLEKYNVSVSDAVGGGSRQR